MDKRAFFEHFTLNKQAASSMKMPKAPKLDDLNSNSSSGGSSSNKLKTEPPTFGGGKNDFSRDTTKPAKIPNPKVKNNSEMKDNNPYNTN